MVSGTKREAVWWFIWISGSIEKKDRESGATTNLWFHLDSFKSESLYLKSNRVRLSYWLFTNKLGTHFI